jgi:hypothetical protein
MGGDRNKSANFAAPGVFVSLLDGKELISQTFDERVQINLTNPAKYYGAGMERVQPLLVMLRRLYILTNHIRQCLDPTGFSLVADQFTDERRTNKSRDIRYSLHSLCPGLVKQRANSSEVALCGGSKHVKVIITMSTETSSSSTGATQRKGMRKGTHSCFEC